MAIELTTGHELWTSEQSFDKYWSFVARGDRILALDQRGILYLLRAGKDKFEPLDQRKLTSAETWAHLALTDDELFMRELNALTACRWTDPAGPREQASTLAALKPTVGCISACAWVCMASAFALR